MYLPSVENNPSATGWRAALAAGLRQAGAEVPQILHLIAYKPEVTEHLERFAQGVMRGRSPLAPGLRELIAAFTSKGNHCLF